MYSDETLWRRLMGKIVDVLAPFATCRWRRARAIQVFDSWVGALGSDDYVRFAAPYSRALIERIRSTGVPVIHFGTGASGFLQGTARGRRRRDGRRLAHEHRPGVDGHQLPLGHSGQPGSGGAVRAAPELRMKVHELLKRTGTRPGHIFNLGHGILPETPVENVQAVVQMVREFRP
jgi:uroporphyrinogen decarboxylase